MHLIKISLKFIPKVPINNIPALVQIMAWRRTGDKPLSEPMMVVLPTHICVTRPQWVKLPEYGTFDIRTFSVRNQTFEVRIWQMATLLLRSTWCIYRIPFVLGKEIVGQGTESAIRRIAEPEIVSQQKTSSLNEFLSCTITADGSEVPHHKWPLAIAKSLLCHWFYIIC